MVQNMSPPAPAGSGSLSFTWEAAAPVGLLTVTVKPIGWPAVTDAVSAVFVTATSGMPRASTERVTVTPPSETLTGPCARSATSRRSMAHCRRTGSG